MLITTKISRLCYLGTTNLFVKNAVQNFSNLKDKFSGVRVMNHANLQQLYSDIRKFQSTLPHTELIKFKKLIHQTDKKVRKLRKIQGQKLNKSGLLPVQLNYQLDGSITGQYFYHKHTQSVYFKQEIPYHKLCDEKPSIKTLSLQQIENLVDSYFVQDMQPFLDKIVSFEQNYSEFFKLMKIRYEAIEQILCRHIFQGYSEFTLESENLFFKTEQKYKGNFKFLPIDPTLSQNKPIIHSFSQILKKLTCLNQYRPKLRLAAEIYLSQNWKDLQSATLSNLLFCTSANGKDLHQISTNFDQFCQKFLSSNQNNQFFNLLFYMAISGIQSIAIFQRADKKISQIMTKLNKYEKLILSALIPYLSQARQIDFILTGKLKAQLLQKQNNSESDCFKDFKKFLDERQYSYEIKPYTDYANIIAPYQMVEIEQKKFLCYSNLFYQPQQSSFSPNGLAKLINEYFSSNNEKIKIINGKKLATLQKWTEKQEYLKSKMKGLTKPQIKKQKKFEFYSPRQQYFDKKQKQKY